jgi:hypothetical protein
MEFAGGAFETRPSSQINGNKHPADLHLDARRNPRTTSFIKAELAAPTTPVGNL